MLYLLLLWDYRINGDLGWDNVSLGASDRYYSEFSHVCGRSYMSNYRE